MRLGMWHIVACDNLSHATPCRTSEGQYVNGARQVYADGIFKDKGERVYAHELYQ
jgi:hypothetical protein